MSTTYLPSILAAAIGRDPIALFGEMGYPARLIFLALIGMAFWICWMVAAKRDASKIHARLRYLKAIGQTAPMLGLLGTAIGTINGLKAVARQSPPSWSLFSGGFSEALVTTAIGILVGVVAHWAATLLKEGHTHAPAR